MCAFICKICPFIYETGSFICEMYPFIFKMCSIFNEIQKWPIKMYTMGKNIINLSAVLSNDPICHYKPT